MYIVYVKIVMHIHVVHIHMYTCVLGLALSYNTGMCLLCCCGSALYMYETCFFSGLLSIVVPLKPLQVKCGRISKHTPCIVTYTCTLYMISHVHASQSRVWHCVPDRVVS